MTAGRPERSRRSVARIVCLSVALATAAACSLPAFSCFAPQQSASTDGSAPSGAAAPSSGPQQFKIVFLGDSLTAGLGLLSDQAYPALVQHKFEGEGYSLVECVNAGISGDTTAGALRRVDDVLEPDVRILFVALGGNDALRGLTTAQTHDNLAAILDEAAARGVSVVLAGMEAPTNLGKDYQDAFHALYIQLAQQYRGRLAFVPFLLDGVAGNPALNQADGIHPNERGAQIIADALYPRLRTLVDQIGGGG
jgi:acyl-CoA thioesterase I